MIVETEDENGLLLTHDVVKHLFKVTDLIITLDRLKTVMSFVIKKKSPIIEKKSVICCGLESCIGVFLYASSKIKLNVIKFSPKINYLFNF